jgi:hypothetical protein
VGPYIPRSKPLWFLYVGKNSKVLCIPTIHMIWRLWNRIFLKQFTTFSNVNCNKFLEICLQEFRHVSQQRADILNIFYDGEYNINYYNWLIINKRSKQCVPAVPAARRIFLGSGAALSQEVANGKTNVQSVCTLNTVYIISDWIKYMSRSVYYIKQHVSVKVDQTQVCIYKIINMLCYIAEYVIKLSPFWLYS